MTPFSSRYQSVTSEADRSKVTPRETPTSPSTKASPHTGRSVRRIRFQTIHTLNFHPYAGSNRCTVQLSISRKGNI